MKNWLKIPYLLVGILIFLLSILLIVGTFTGSGSQILFGLILVSILIIIGGGFFLYGLGYLKINKFSNISFTILILSFIASIFILEKVWAASSFALLFIFFVVFFVLSLVRAIGDKVSHKDETTEGLSMVNVKNDFSPDIEKNTISKKRVIFGVLQSFLFAIISLIALPLFLGLTIDLIPFSLAESGGAVLWIIALWVVMAIPFVSFNTLVFFLYDNRSYKRGILIGYIFAFLHLLYIFWGSVGLGS